MLPVRWRLTSWFSFLLGVALVGLGLLTYMVLSHQLMGEVDERIHQLALQVHRDLNIQQQESQQLLSIAPSRLASSSSEFAAPALYVQILDSEGTLLVSSPNLRGEQLPVDPSVVWDGIRGRTSQVTLLTLTDDRVRIRTIPMIHGDSVVGLIQVGQSLHHVNQTLQWLALLLGTGVASVWLAATLLGWIMAGRALKPISSITETAASIAATGDFETRIAYQGPTDEIGHLAQTFNRMIERLESAFHYQQQFIADSSHELGTPIAVIKGNAELLARPLHAADAQEALEAIRSEAARMDRIVSDLLDMADLDRRGDVAFDPVRLDLLAKEVFSRTRGVARDLTLNLAEAESAIVLGNSDWLRQLVMNLLDNAIKYTPPGGLVEMRIVPNGPWAELAVSDTGVGIPEESQDRIFDRFYRVDKARSRARGGTGLGLPISKAIAEAHGGTILLSSRVGHGSTFTVRLPLVAHGDPEPLGAEAQTDRAGRNGPPPGRDHIRGGEIASSKSSVGMT